MEASLVSEFKARLEAERDSLTAEIEQFERDGLESLSTASGENNYRDHMADQGSATFARELDLTLEGQARDALAQVERALQRIADGTYGKCANCEGEIPVARLEAMPEAELCLACKEREESI